MSESIWTIIIVVAVAALAITSNYLRKSVAPKDPPSNSIEVSSSFVQETSKDLDFADLPLSFSELSTTADKSRLIEVKDVQLISRLDAVIPSALNTVAQYMNKIPQNAVLIDIPYKDLVKSKAIDGAKRAFARGKGGIAKNANLSQLSLDKGAQLANIGAGVMNVAALVVGQQLMSEINSKLSELNEGISALQDIAKAEIMSKILANLAMVLEISNAQIEILESPELRQNKLNSIDEHKKSVIQLLGQVNLMIEQKTSNSDYQRGSKGFKAYEKTVTDLNELTTWQSTLVGLLEQISRLSHALSLGVISLEKSNAVYLQYLEVTKKVNKDLELWHSKQIESLQIDFENGRAAKGIIEQIPGYIVPNLKFLEVKEDLSASIAKQQSSRITFNAEPDQLFESDVQLAMIDGKYFYSPNNVDK